MGDWNLQDTLRLVHAKFGPDQLRLAEAPLRAIKKRNGFAVHTGEVLRQFDAADRNLGEAGELSTVLFDEHLRTRHFDFQNAIAANALAALESLYAVGDLLALGVFHSLRLAPLGGAPFLSKADITYQNVLAFARGQSSCRLVAPALHGLKSPPGSFEYIEAVVEFSRQGEIVSAGVWFDNTGRDPEGYRLEFPSFSYLGKGYGARQVEPVLLTGGLLVQRSVEAIMQAVNVALDDSSDTN